MVWFMLHNLCINSTVYNIGVFSKKGKQLEWILPSFGNIVQMRKNGSKVVASMLDVKLKIIWKLSENIPLLMIKNWKKLIWFLNSPNYNLVTF